MNKYDKAHIQNLAAIERQIEAIYQSAIREAARLGVSLGAINPDKVFSFADYPVTKGRVDKLLQGLKNRLYTCIVNGINAEWTLSNNKNNELARQVFGDNVGKLSQQQYRRYFSTNDEARKAFIQRKTNGLKLSDRVWNYTTGFQREIELGLDVGIRNGMSVADMTKELGLFLKHPDKLFRRVRDEHGNLNPSKRASEFHPGRGVYRSSYMNARRLAATETNIAYRTSDYLRWQDMDFVVGIRVVMSNNHTCLGRDGKPHPFTDICDELSAPLNFDKNSKQGCYPKDFKFTGWHPHCRCHVLSILKTAEEMAEDDKRIDRGEELRCESENKVTEPPKEFTAWLSDNKSRIEQAEQLPNFIADNKKLLLGGKFGYTGDRLGRKGTAEARAAFENHTGLTNYSEEQQANFTDIERELSIKRGAPMTFDEADHGKANNQGDKDNCAVAVIAHELRLRGFDITALPYTGKGHSLAVSVNTLFPWITPKHKTPQFTAMLSGNADDIIAKLEKQTSPIGSRYHFGYDTKLGGGHIVTAERTKNGLVLYDPQRDDFINIKTLLSEMAARSKLEVLRVDRLLLNPKLIKGLIEAI